jgi:hypothetical protein
MKRTRTDEIVGYVDLTFSEDEKERIRGIQGLCPCHVKFNDHRVWDRILQLVDDPSANVRSHVFHTLADGSPNELRPQVVAAIEKLQRDSDPKLRRRARKLMAHYRRKGRVNIL